MKSLRYRCQQSKESLLAGQPYRFIDNGGSILGVAHVDFVGCWREQKFRQKGRKVFSTTLDDRLGVHILLDRLPLLGIVCDVLLTDDEESGQSTASQFVPTKKYNWIFEFDRQGAGAVIYEFDSMYDTAKKYFGKVHYGSFSDICSLAHLGVAGINIGTGYYQEHSVHSWANLNVVNNQLRRFHRMYLEMGGTRIDYTAPPPRKYKKWEDYSSSFNSNYTKKTVWSITDGDWIVIDPGDVEHDGAGFSYVWDFKREDWIEIDLDDRDRDLSPWDHYLAEERAAIEEQERERTRS